MAYSTRSYARGYLSGSRLPPGIKWLLIANTAVFLLEWLADHVAPSARLTETLEYYFALTPAAVVGSLRIWQPVTYMFLHAGIWHILWNMLALWMFGVELEQTWGTEKFLRFYFLCGIGAGVCVVLMNYLFGDPRVATVGASGAIYGVLAASAALWPDRIILALFFPIKMKYFVGIIAAITFLNSWNPNSGVSDFAHLSGLLIGFLYVKWPRWSTSGSGFHPLAGLQSGYLTWKRNRARRKFQVYLSKQARGRDRW
ncbi:MAG TPA: rhomboid family intramembrane serine protease [Bryobacteraceae bacterium]